MAVAIRAMTDTDVDAAIEVQIAAFADLDRRERVEPQPTTDAVLERSRHRHQHLIKHDPGGAFVAVDGDRLVGSALALRRGDLWGLSLLVVDPAVQSAGIGRRLLDASLGYAAGCVRGVILSTSDARAMRAYATSGFTLHPQMNAVGVPDRSSVPSLDCRVRVGTALDIALANRIDETVRRAAHGPDHDLMSGQLLMFAVDDVEGRGYAYLRSDGYVYLLAATDDATATALLWRCVAHLVEVDQPMTIDHLNAEQQWAIDVAYRARLSVAPAGPVFWRGDTPPRCYLPSGAYL